MEFKQVSRMDPLTVEQDRLERLRSVTGRKLLI